MQKGTVYWITGLSGAGKTTVGKLLFKYLKSKKENVVFLDGDIIREVYQVETYDMASRKNLSFLYGRLCKMLSDQNIDVVIGVIAMFEECRQWNRENIENYKEIYLQVSMEELIRRDQKQLYSRALRHEISNVMGIDMDYEEPQNPDITIDNSGAESPEQVLSEIIKQLDFDEGNKINEVYYKKYVASHLNYYILYKWMFCNMQGKTLDAMLNQQNISRVAIYGIGEMGGLIFESLKNTDITVDCFVDSYAVATHYGLESVEVLRPVDFVQKAQVDLVIISLANIAESIKKDLVSIGVACPIVSIEDIILNI